MADLNGRPTDCVYYCKSSVVPKSNCLFCLKVVKQRQIADCCEDQTQYVPRDPFAYIIQKVPILVSNLSERNPIRGVDIPSVAWPIRKTGDAASVCTILLRKKTEKLIQVLPDKSLMKWPTA